MKSLGANLDILDRGGDPPLIQRGHVAGLGHGLGLIELGADVDYENGKSRQPLSLAFKGRYPAPDSPLYPYKLKVWHFLKDRGIAVGRRMDRRNDAARQSAAAAAARAATDAAWSALRSAVTFCALGRCSISLM